MKTHHSASTLSVIALLALGLGACAQRPPSDELVAARSAYDEARRGPAASLAPDKLFGARNALEKAEAEHSKDAQSAEERHFAYIAERVAMIADVYGELAFNQREGMLAAQDFDRLQEDRRRTAESQLASSEAQLESEREARRAAETKLRAALQSLAEIAQVKEESRGLVITLNGSVLFATNRSELLPTAKMRLDEVATALKDLKPGQTITVEGHTDSVGGDDQNMKLSQARAQSVTDYLSSRGVSQKITAIGKGETVPLADNNSPEGRANNRRVEIVISHESMMSPSTGRPGGS